MILIIFAQKMQRHFKLRKSKWRPVEIILFMVQLLYIISTANLEVTNLSSLFPFILKNEIVFPNVKAFHFLLSIYEISTVYTLSILLSTTITACNNAMFSRIFLIHYSYIVDLTFFAQKAYQILCP